jgi:hypothetical protein
MGELTKDWEVYEAGKKYNGQIKCINDSNYYDLVDALIDFVNGNQWRNLEVTGMRKPVFNICSKALRFWVASIASTNTKVNLEPLEYTSDKKNPTEKMNIAKFATAEISNLFEKFKMDNRIRDGLHKAGTIGDVAAHIWFDKSKKPYGGAYGDYEGEICFELVNGTNVFFINANNSDKESQPAIALSGRDLVKNLKAEAKKYRATNNGESDSNENQITEDSDYGYEAGDAAEIEIEADGYGKATYILIYKKVNKTRANTRTSVRQQTDEFNMPMSDEEGNPLMEEYEEEFNEEYETIIVSKSVKNTYIYEDIDTGLNVYPVFWLTWDKQESQYHGRMPLAEILETQIFINLMFAMIMFHLAMTAFPKAIYNADYIEEWNNQIAEAIPVSGMQAGENITNYAGYLEPGRMSEQIIQTIKLAFDLLKYILGIDDAATGNINPEQASGTAIVATVRQSSIPLENTRSNMYEWIEDIVRGLLDMMGTNYGERPVLIEENGEKRMVMFDFSVLKHIWLNIRTDVGSTNVWDDAARKRTMDNLLTAGKIEIIQWLESMSDKDVPNRQKLIDDIRENLNLEKMKTKEGINEAFESWISTLPPELQQALSVYSQQFISNQAGKDQMPA